MQHLSIVSKSPYKNELICQQCGCYEFEQNNEHELVCIDCGFLVSGDRLYVPTYQDYKRCSKVNLYSFRSSTNYFSTIFPNTKGLAKPAYKITCSYDAKYYRNERLKQIFPVKETIDEYTMDVIRSSYRDLCERKTGDGNRIFYKFGNTGPLHRKEIKKILLSVKSPLYPPANDEERASGITKAGRLLYTNYIEKWIEIKQRLNPDEQPEIIFSPILNEEFNREWDRRDQVWIAIKEDLKDPFTGKPRKSRIHTSFMYSDIFKKIMPKMDATNLLKIQRRLPLFKKQSVKKCEYFLDKVLQNLH